MSGLPFPPPGDLPDPGIETVSPALQADSLPLSHQGSTWRVGVLSKHFLSKQKWAPSSLFPVTPKAGALPLNFRGQLGVAASQISWVWPSTTLRGPWGVACSRSRQPSAWGNHYFLFDLSAADSCLNLKFVLFSPITFFFLLLVLHSITQSQFPPILHPPPGKWQAEARFRSKDMGIQNQVLSTWTRCHSRHRNCNCSSGTICEPLYSFKGYYPTARPVPSDINCPAHALCCPRHHVYPSWKELTFQKSLLTTNLLQDKYN